MAQNPYKTLGILETASDEELTKAFRKLAKKYHPDINKGDKNSEVKMREINAAYTQIKDLRAHGKTFGETEYDAYGQRTQGGQNYSPYQSVEVYIRARHFSEALHVLSTIKERNAEWYYYSSIAYAGSGNTIIAVQHAQQSVDMEPDNIKYQSILSQLQNNGRVYQQYGNAYNIPNININKSSIGFCLAQILCWTFCCR